VTVDLVIAGRRIRLHSREGVEIRPDERFSAFTAPAEMPFAVHRDILPETVPDTLPQEGQSLTGAGMLSEDQCHTGAGMSPENQRHTGAGMLPEDQCYTGAGMPPEDQCHTVAGISPEDQCHTGAGMSPEDQCHTGAGISPGDQRHTGTGMSPGSTGTFSDRVTGEDHDLDADSDLVVEVEPGPGEIPASAEKVFDAQLMEEVPGGVINSGEPFWEIFSGGGVTYARVFLKEPERTALLEMPNGEKRWRIFTGEVTGAPEDVGVRVTTDSCNDRSGLAPDNFISPPVTGPHQVDAGVRVTADLYSDRSGLAPDNFISPHRTDPSQDNAGPDHQTAGTIAEAPITVNPLPYPLDGLLFYFLFSRAGDIMIHGSGVSCQGRGWLFTGRSGSGKTTLARIFDRAGDSVIHDDRLVLCRSEDGWMMHNTPVYRNDEPRSAPLDHLWIIRHGSANVSEPVTGAEAVAMILANSIQQNWDRVAAARLAAAADDLTSSVRVSRLSFLPDGTIREYLRLRKEEEISIAASAAGALLSAGKNITVTAGGYSMWPAIRPGDKVEIAPFVEGAAAAGRIVALRRDGGFVLHRITRVMTVSGRRVIVTSGDAAARADEPAGAGMIAGIVLSVTRSGRLITPPRRRWPRWMNRITAAVAGWVRG
jgi:energy-coupling factor transporter ATP-binding protein EcfA2